MTRKNKRGISPLIATVLVIGFTIVLAAMVITWGTRLFQTTVSETESESKFSLVCTTGLRLDVVKRCELAAGDTTCTLNLRNNNQQRDIEDFRAVLNFDGGTSEEGTIAPTSAVDSKLEFPVPKQYDVGLGTGSTQTDLDTLVSISLYPTFTIDGETKSCENPINVNV